MADEPSRKTFLTFWTTLPGILSGLAAVITAVAGLITAIYVLQPGDDPPPEPTLFAAPTPTFVNSRPTLGPVVASRPTVASTPLPTEPLQEGELPITEGSIEAVLRPGDRNVHRLEVSPEARVEVTVEASGGCFRVAVMDPARSEFAESSDECSIYEYFTILTDASSGGPYYLEVEGGSAALATSYSIDALPYTQDDGGSGGDAGGTPESAVLIDGTRSVQGVLGSQDRDDFYRFRADARTVLEVQHAAWDNLDVRLLALDPSGGVSGQVSVPRSQPVDFSQRQPGNYVLRISNRGPEGVYTIILGTRPGT